VDDRKVALLLHPSSTPVPFSSFFSSRLRCWFSASTYSFFLPRSIVSPFIPIFFSSRSRILVPLLLVFLINEKSD
jgi:hypothetical protein